MNQRQLKPEKIFIPEGSHRPKPKPRPADESRPEERMFDKADLAENEAKAEETLKEVLAEIERLGKAQDAEADEATVKAKISELEAKRARLETEIKQRQEQKKEEADEEPTR